QALAGLPGLVTPRVGPYRTHVYHQYTLRITPRFRHSRDQVANALEEAGVATAIYYPIPVHRQASMRRVGLGEGTFPLAERLAGEVLSIPVHPGLTETERSEVADALLKLATA
ncbi:MAG: DegT/DnrJ/EryC1/StrS family aminotransferase, partial [Chloroflexi bacterium]|nr:DegT/DnrJ/EryC1/StrS family aminotransferase [Chloroflexota bacterium]